MHTCTHICTHVHTHTKTGAWAHALHAVCLDTKTTYTYPRHTNARTRHAVASNKNKGKYRNHIILFPSPHCPTSYLYTPSLHQHTCTSAGVCKQGKFGAVSNYKLSELKLETQSVRFIKGKSEKDKSGSKGCV